MDEISPKVKKQLENMAELYHRDYETILNYFKVAQKKLQEKTGKSGSALILMSVRAVKAHLAEQEVSRGREVNFIYLGKDRTRDQNKSIVNKRLKKFHSDPDARKKMMKNGKVLMMRIKGKDPEKDGWFEAHKPVTKVVKSTNVDDEIVVMEGEIWEPGCGKDPILRDDREYLDDNNTVENFNYGRILNERWTTTIFGIGYFEDSPKLKKKMEISFYGEMSNPNSGLFVCKGMKMWQPYKLKVKLNENKSDDLTFNCTGRTKPLLTKKPGTDIDIIGMIDKLNQDFSEKLVSKGKDPRSLIPVVPLSDLKEWHKEYRALKNDEGKIIKKRSGWDVVNWSEYAIIDMCTYLGIAEFTNTFQPATIQHDSTGKQSFYMNFDPHINFEEIPIPSDLHIVVKTGRGTTRYDREKGEKIQNAEDPDLRISICGYDVVQSYDKIDFEKELVGDL